MKFALSLLLARSACLAPAPEAIQEFKVQTGARKSGATQDRLNQYFNTAAFVRAGNLWDDTGRNILRGPNQRNIDFSVNKHFALTERVGLEWRSEFFNLLNITNFASPGSSITAATYGVIRSTTGNPRVIQFALKLAF